MSLMGHFSISSMLEPLAKAPALLRQSVALDPAYSRPHIALSFVYVTLFRNRLNEEFGKDSTLEKAFQAARTAVQLDPSSPAARAHLGLVLTWKRQYDAALRECEAATRLNPNYRDWRLSVCRLIAGDAEKSIEIGNDYVRFDPFHIPLAAGFLGQGYYQCHRYEEAAAYFDD